MSENSRMEVIWGVALLDEGFTSIPNLIIRNYRKLGIEHGEFGFICQLLTYKHDTRDPFPSREELAANLCCSIRQIDKWTSSLVAKGLLITGQRKNKVSKKWGNAVYKLKPLIDACLLLVGDKPLPDSPDDFDVVWNDDEAGYDPRVLQVRADFVPQVRAVPTPEVRTKKKSKNDHIKNDCLIVAPVQVAAAAEEFIPDEIYIALQETVPKTCFTNGMSLGLSAIAEIYLMLINQFPNQLSAEVVRMACDLYFDRSQRIAVTNPTGFFHDSYADAIKLWKAQRTRQAPRKNL